jgi:hypothetical protein
MNYSLSDSDLRSMIPNVNIVKYNDLANYNSIDEVLKGRPTVVLFELVKHNNGHWICLFKNGKTIYFFDSYGVKIEDQKCHMNKQFFRSANYLSKMLKDSPYKVDYNATQYQEYSPNIANCGRYCIVRLRCMDLNDAEFKQVMDEACKELNMNADEVVVELTKLHLGK